MKTQSTRAYTNNDTINKSIDKYLQTQRCANKISNYSFVQRLKQDDGYIINQTLIHDYEYCVSLDGVNYMGAINGGLKLYDTPDCKYELSVDDLITRICNYALVSTARHVVLTNNIQTRLSNAQIRDLDNAALINGAWINTRDAVCKLINQGKDVLTNGYIYTGCKIYVAEALDRATKLLNVGYRLNAKDRRAFRELEAQAANMDAKSFAHEFAKITGRKGVASLSTLADTMYRIYNTQVVYIDAHDNQQSDCAGLYGRDNDANPNTPLVNAEYDNVETDIALDDIYATISLTTVSIANTAKRIAYIRDCIAYLCKDVDAKTIATDYGIKTSAVTRSAAEIKQQLAANDDFRRILLAA